MIKFCLFITVEYYIFIIFRPFHSFRPSKYYEDLLLLHPLPCDLPSQPGFVAVEEYVHKLVKPSVDHVCRLKLPSGNYPPCIGDDRDLLVHWCHGSPGVIYMLLQAYRVGKH